MPEEKELSLPGSSWERVKKIIRAFLAANDEEKATVEDIAKLAGVTRPIVSMNNNFLRSVGIVRGDQWKLTEVGLRYATGLQMNNASMAAESLAEAVRGNSILSQLLGLLLARGEMNVDTFKAEVMLKVGITPNDRQAMFFKPLLDMLQEAGLIETNGDTVAVVSMYGLGSAGRGENPPPPPPRVNPPPRDQGLPILLGPNRIVYVRLPDDWDGKKDLSKLLKLLEISLGDGL